MGRFVILEHRWRGLHFDLMLERDGRLQTWAIDEELVAERDLPARALPPHRLLYLDYEGPISGDRGEVRRVDRGTFAVRAWAEEEIRVDLRGDRWSGPLTIGRVADDDQETPGTAWRIRLGKVD